ncbi:DUF58 domain-containing protein [Aquabacterium lacunae]|uniref:DUF58 domain-containing protein n=1 Tax=Aquabacterium lacunae TaxID=2528630 RepID=A0A4Q9H4U4_9BURK|nr:DUF58 domain-containing protein [Aquabacterium lacunae]TBO32604.1 DUF58 domain-containing protein [Aquabacterium lacunae]
MPTADPAPRPRAQPPSDPAPRGLKAWLRRRWQQWADQRQPRQATQVFTQRNLYIVPSGQGGTFLLVCGVLLLASINEQVNLGYALTFLLGGVGFAAMGRSHANLRGVTLSLQALPRLHAGQSAALPVQLDAPPEGRAALGVQLTWPGEHTVWADAPARGSCAVTVPLRMPERGEHLLPRLRVQSRYPLGLFTVWGYWRPAQTVLVWPAPESPCPPWPSAPGEAVSGSNPGGAGSATPDELREWQPGDSLRQVVWRKSAWRMDMHLPPVVREPQPEQPPKRLLRWEDTSSLGHTEARLSRLTAWLIEAERQAAHGGGRYALSLPGTAVPDGAGQAHLQQCLDLLARWPR